MKEGEAPSPNQPFTAGAGRQTASKTPTSKHPLRGSALQLERDTNFDPKKEDVEIELVSDIELITDRIDNSKVLLRDTPSRSIYLTKVGVTFIVYFLGIALLGIILQTNEEVGRYYYRLYALDSFDVLLVMLVIFIKVLFGFFGHKLRSFSTIFFLIDLVLSIFAYLSAYFWFENFMKSQYIWSGHYWIIIGVNLFASSVAFTFSTLRLDDVKSYNYMFGILLMLVANLITCSLFYNYLDIVTMKFTKYIYLLILFGLIDIYVAINAYLVVNYRVTKFYDHEFIFCYFCFWVDWFSYFWMDAFGSDRNEVRRIMEQKRLIKLEREKAAKEEKRLERLAAKEKREGKQSEVPNPTQTQPAQPTHA